MKTIIAAIAAAIAFSGCSTLLKPSVTETPVTVPGHTNVIVVTNTLPPVVVTNTVAGAPVVVTNYAPPVVVTNVLITPPTVTVLTVTNWVPNPTIVSGIATAKELNSNLNPTPSAPFVNWGLTGLTAVLGAVAAWKNKQAGTANALVNTVTTAVETYPGAGLSGLKAHIAGVSAILGTTDALDKVVQATSTKVADAVPAPVSSLTAADLVALAQNPSADLSSLSQSLQAAIAKIRA